MSEERGDFFDFVVLLPAGCSLLFVLLKSNG